MRFVSERVQCALYRNCELSQKFCSAENFVLVYIFVKKIDCNGLYDAEQLLVCGDIFEDEFTDNELLRLSFGRV